MRLGSRLAPLLSILLSLGHLLRLVARVEVVVGGGMTIPLLVSVPACLATGGIAWLLWRERREAQF